MKCFANFTLLSGAFLLLLSACNPKPTLPTVDATPYHFDVPEGFPAPADPDENLISAAKVALGKRLFYDPILSSDYTISCNSCHKQGYAFADQVAISPGVEGRLGLRNAPSLVNLAYVSVFHKDGGVPKLDMQAGTPIEDADEMNLPIQQAAERLNAIPSYEDAFYQAYGKPANSFTITRALAAFIRTMISGDSPYDQYTFQGKAAAMTAAQLRGQALFFSDRLACSSCHSGFNFAQDSFFNNGLKLNYGRDPGRQRVTIDTLDVGKFRVPSLRNVARTAPYMHNGSLPDLEGVVEHYNQGGVGHPLQDRRIKVLALSPTEKEDLIAFLNALTDEGFIKNEGLKKN
ncbi:MAG: cytochrome c peroxidase [Bacteroidota bacterium]